MGDDLRSTALAVNPWSDHADARPHITARTRWARARELSGLAHAPIVAALQHALVAALQDS